jgi:shikimate dehydrogenase
MTEKTLKGAVLGSPIKHSLSPVLHMSAFKFLGIQGQYSAIEVNSGDLRNFLENFASDMDYLSLTMPLKEEALELDLDFDSEGLRIRSINTLVKRNGRWSASSTDGSGFTKALQSAGYSKFNRILILGAGGTARAIAGVISGFTNDVHVMGRSQSRADSISTSVVEANFQYLTWDDCLSIDSYDLVINTTPAGAADLFADSISRVEGKLLFDVIYKPWPTVLGRRWSDSGGKVLNGLELLIYQGIDQLALITQIPDVDSLAKHLRQVLSNRK